MWEWKEILGYLERPDLPLFCRGVGRGSPTGFGEAHCVVGVC